MSLLSKVSTSASQLPSRVFLYAREKWGKSSLFAFAPKPIFFMTRGETGLVELIAGGRVPPTAHFAYDESDPPNWETLRAGVRELIREQHDYKTLIIDTANGAEILCQDHVRNTQFKGRQALFASYGKGNEACRPEWLALLQDLDELRAKRRMSVVMVAHTTVKKFDDPTQEEGYDKYRPACVDKLWDLTHKWADVICFGHFKAVTFEAEGGKTKAKNEVQRVLCFDPSPVWDAGNRYGLTGQLNVSGGAKAAFGAFAQMVAAAKSAGQPKPEPKPKAAASAPAADPADPDADPLPPGKPGQLFDQPSDGIPH